MAIERTQPLMISVIIPVHNGSNFLSRCLQAVAASDYPHYECIVVDDGSTDGSQAIAKEFPIRLLELTGGPFGPAYARNRGAEAASGEILVFVDADVVIRPDTLTKVAETFARPPHIDAVFGSYDESPEAGEFVSQYKNLFHHFVHQQGREDAATFWAGCGAIRREAFFEVGGFDEDRYPRPSIEDIELGCRLRAAGHKILLDKQIQVKHLKRWTFLGMLKSDIFDRGIPWTLLILRERNLPNDLNLSLSQRASALLLWVMLLHLGSVAFFPNIVILPSLLIISLILLLNHQFYTFLARKRGVMFGLAVVPFHWLYYLYGTFAFALGASLYLWNTGVKREVRVGVEARNPLRRQALVEGDRVFQDLVEQLTRSLKVTVSSIVTLDEQEDTLVVRAACPIRRLWTSPLVGRRIPLSDAPTYQQVIQEERPLLFRQNGPALATSSQGLEKTLTSGLKSAALLPVTANGEVVGVISLGEMRTWERSPFTEEKLEQSQSLVAQWKFQWLIGMPHQRFAPDVLRE